MPVLLRCHLAVFQNNAKLFSERVGKDSCYLCECWIYFGREEHEEQVKVVDGQSITDNVEPLH